MIHRKIMFAAFSLFICFRAGAEEAQRLLESATLFGEKSALILRLEMRIESQGSERIREVELMIDRSKGRLLTLARIISPSFLTGMKFLKIREPGKPDMQWLKTSSGLRRLGESNRSEAIFGSNFTVEDFGAIDSAGFDVSLIPEKNTTTAKAILVKPKIKTYYAEKILWVETLSGLVSAMQYCDSTGRLIKRYEVTSFSGDRSQPVDAKMYETGSGSATLLHVLSLETQPTLADRFFSPGAL